MRLRFDRLFNWHYLVPVLTVVAVGSLFLSTIAVVGYTNAQTQREKDRVAADLAACELSNDLIGQVTDLADSTDTLIHGIIDTLTARSTEERKREIDRVLAPPFAAYDKDVAEVGPNDCDALIEGSVRLPGTEVRQP